MTSVWYESPQRIIATLARHRAGRSARRVFMLREYTKLHEQQILGTRRSRARHSRNPFAAKSSWSSKGRRRRLPLRRTSEIDAAIDSILETGASVSAIAKALVERGLGERRHSTHS